MRIGFIIPWALAAVLSAEGQAGEHAKSVILLIGDGMGPAQRTLAHYASGEVPAMDQLPIAGLMTTQPAPPPEEGVVEITDSAAAGTAMACGVKTYNEAIGVDLQKREVQTVLEAAAARGKASGLVVTCQVNHATPAAFAAHDESRENYDAIAVDYLTSRPTVILGGGTDYFLPAGGGGARADGRNLEREFQDLGYTLVHDASALTAATHGPLLGLFAPKALTPSIDRDPSTGEPTLAEATRKALEILSQDPDGFFLMVEGSQIDWGCHAQDASYVASELRAFDEAVKVARDFASRDGRTLIVVLADHETGGLSIGRDYRFDAGALRKIQRSYRAILDVMRSDPAGAEQSLVTLAGLDSLTAEERGLFSDPAKIPAAVTDLLNRRVGLGWNSHDHSGCLIPVTAEGPGSQAFTGVYDNTDIPVKIAAALDFPFRPGAR